MGLGKCGGKARGGSRLKGMPAAQGASMAYHLGVEVLEQRVVDDADAVRPHDAGQRLELVDVEYLLRTEHARLALLPHPHTPTQV